MRDANTADIWLMLDRSRAIVGEVPSQPAPQVSSSKPPKTRAQRVQERTLAILRDAVAAAFWLYVGLQLFVIDVFSLAFGPDSTSARFILTHRAIPVALLGLLLGIFLWRWRVLWTATYVLFFPLIIVFWKLPKLFIKTRFYRNAVAVMALINVAMLMVKNFRYHVISKCAVVIAVALIMLGTSSTPILLGACMIVALLSWALIRVIFQTFRSGTFVASQRKLLSLASKFTDSPLELKVTQQPDGTVSKQEADQIVTTIQSAAITNRLLYLWAYKVQQYREASFVLVFNVLSYAALFLGATIAFFLLNLAVYHVFPGQYSGPSNPSVLALYLYSLSSMAFADGGGISPSGDLAYGVRIVAEMFGPGFLLTVVVNTLLVLRGSREDTELRETVNDLRRQARQHEARFQQALRVNIDEAAQRLVALGMGNLLAFLVWLRQAVPSDFIGDDINSVE